MDLYEKFKRWIKQFYLHHLFFIIHELENKDDFCFYNS